MNTLLSLFDLSLNSRFVEYIQYTIACLLGDGLTIILFVSQDFLEDVAQEIGSFIKTVEKIKSDSIGLSYISFTGAKRRRDHSIFLVPYISNRGSQEDLKEKLRRQKESLKKWRTLLILIVIVNSFISLFLLLLFRSLFCKNWLTDVIFYCLPFLLLILALVFGLFCFCYWFIKSRKNERRRKREKAKLESDYLVLAGKGIIICT